MQQRRHCYKRSILVQNKYYAADAVTINKETRTVTCMDDGQRQFNVRFDMLAIATGSQV